MYKDLRAKRPTDIIIDVERFSLECGGCPTIYDFVDTDGTNYSFYLRYGTASLECIDTDELLLSERMHGYDGVCNFSDLVDWARKNRVQLNAK